MRTHTIALSACCVLSAVATLATGLSCLSENGSAVDWWIIMKRAKSGGYLYLDSAVYASGGRMALSPYSLTDAKRGAMSLTLNAAMQQSFAFYNDWVPPGAVWRGNSHSAGVIGADNRTRTGIFMPHSFVSFPNAFGPYAGFPVKNSPLASSAMCMSMNAANLELVTATMDANPPNFFRCQMDPALKNSVETPYYFCNGGHRVPSHAPFVRFASTLGGLKVTTFVKDTKMDMYSVLMSPYYKADLYTATWMGGHGTPLPNACRPQSKYQIINLSSFGIGGVSQSSSSDHSKLTFIPSKGVFCIGDENRMSGVLEPGRTHCVELPAFVNSLSWSAMSGGCS